MTDLTVAAETCVALGATEHQFESYPGRDIALAALTVTRVLPGAVYELETGHVRLLD